MSSHCWTTPSDQGIERLQTLHHRQTLHHHQLHIRLSAVALNWFIAPLNNTIQKNESICGHPSPPMQNACPQRQNLWRDLGQVVETAKRHKAVGGSRQRCYWGSIRCRLVAQEAARQPHQFFSKRLQQHQQAQPAVFSCSSQRYTRLGQA